MSWHFLHLKWAAPYPATQMLDDSLLMNFKNAVHCQRFYIGYNRYQPTASLMLVLPGDLIL